MADRDDEIKVKVEGQARQFSWAGCSNEVDEYRIMVKEQALQECLTRMAEIERCLQEAFMEMPASDDDTFLPFLLGKEQLMKCIQHYCAY